MNFNKIGIKYALVLIVFWETCKEYIPNVLSLSRIPATLFLTLSVVDESYLNSLFLSVYIALSDWADGYFARKCGVEGEFGANLDAFVDKLILIPMWVMITQCDFLIDELNYLIYLMLIREVWIILLRWKRRRKSKSSSTAKWKTGLQFAVIIIYPLMHLNTGLIFFLLLCCLYLCLLIATYLSMESGWKYTFRPVWV